MPAAYPQWNGQRVHQCAMTSHHVRRQLFRVARKVVQRPLPEKSESRAPMVVGAGRKDEAKPAMPINHPPPADKSPMRTISCFSENSVSCRGGLEGHADGIDSSSG
jgi:hypothetical protein